MTDRPTGRRASEPARKVLISAYACGPGDAPEAAAGWAFVEAAAANAQVWVLTRRRFLPALEKAIAESPAIAGRVHLVPLDLGPTALRLKRHGWDVYWYYPLWQRRAARVASQLHATIDFDVLHHATFANDWMPAGVAKVRGVPFVWGPVGGASRVPLGRLHRWLGVRGVVTEVVRTALTGLPRALWGRAAARRADLVVAQNPDVAHAFRRAHDVVVEPNAALRDDLPERSAQRAAATAVFAGRLLAWKGAALAIEAFADPRLADWRLQVIGDGYERRRLERLVRRLGISDRVLFRGHLRRDETLGELAQADALIFPSMHDQAGWIVAEASSIGLPVVCLPLGGPPTLAGVNACVVELGPRLPTRLADALLAARRMDAAPHRRWRVERLPALVDEWYRRASTRARPALRVMESLSRPRPTTNPYLVQLCESLTRTPGVELSFFTWRQAIVGRLDVFHVHWPELMVGGHRLAGRIVRRFATAAFLIRIAVTRVAVVRTLHNIERPEGLGRIDSFLLDRLDALTTTTIRLNDSTPVTGPAETILHGHYRDWFDARGETTVEGRVAFVGLVRRYKGVETLVEAFRTIDDPALSLQVSGKPSTVEIEATLRDLASDDERVALEFGFLDDAALARRISQAELVVLPYRFMHNSGTVLAALSLDRPVLVPDNEVNRALAEEVGPGWLHLFDGELTGDDVSRAIEAVRASPQATTPDLHSRDWDLVGHAHAAAFRRAAALAGRAR